MNRNSQLKDIKMKFLIIASSPLSVLNFRGKLLEAINDAGLEIHIAAPEFNLHPEELDKLKLLGYQVHNIPMQRTGTNPISDIKTLKSLFFIIKNIEPQYVLSYTIKPVIYGTIAAWLNRVPNRFALITGLGYTFQNVEETGKRSKFQRVIHELYRKALSKVNHIFFQNPDDLNLFKHLKLIEMSTPTTVVNGSGIDLEKFKLVALPVTENDFQVNFLMIARLIGDKGIREYINAAKILKSKYPHVNFNLVGPLDSNPSAITQEELDQFINQGNINYLGKLTDVRPAIAESSVFVLPSYREGTPRTVLESMALGRPIITTNAPGCRETVVDGLNGFLVPVKSVDALVIAMQKFILNPSLISTMGAASRRLAEEKFDVNKVNEVMLDKMGINKTND